MLRDGKIEWPRDVWGNILKPGNPTIYEPNIRDIGRVHPSVLGTCKVQRDWCKRMQPFSTALALGLLATRIRARHGSFEDARAAWALEGTDPREEALAEMRQASAVLANEGTWPTARHGSTGRQNRPLIA